MNHILEVDSIQLNFRERTVLSNIYLKCETGKITGVLGRNGEGKSCLMKIIYGTLKCEKSVRIDNQSYDDVFKQFHLIHYLPQFNFIPANLSLNRIFKDYGLDFAPFQKRFPEFIQKSKSCIKSLSGGERRLIELYIIVKPDSCFAMLDEPFTHLNPIQIEKVKDLLIEEKKSKGLLITDHMFQHVTSISDNLYVLAGGKMNLTKNIKDLERLGYARF